MCLVELRRISQLSRADELRDCTGKFDEAGGNKDNERLLICSIRQFHIGGTDGD
jgi:hypothetical protein